MNTIDHLAALRAARLRREAERLQQPIHIRVDPNTEAMNDRHMRPSIFTRMAQWATAERADYVIGCIGVIGTVVAFGWTLINWMTLRGWL